MSPSSISRTTGGRCLTSCSNRSALASIDADFHLFHGIPPLWARRAFPLRNVIAMTVWETDAMPPQWRPALNHAVEVWLPCQFNVSVFERALGKTVFRLPHAWAPNDTTPAPDLVEACGIQEGDFVFYSIFEWQERKGPNEMIEVFLRAFPEPAPVVLVLKTNPGAAAISKSTLADLRRRVPSQARIELRPEAWSEEQMAALQQRGDCYVSLHRGEGWNYPLFEAAGRGKSIVATGFSGPTEYLDATAHRLVRHRHAAVRQRYAFYSTTMHWAEPEIDHAIEMLRAAFAERGCTGPLSAAAERIRRDFASETIGECARQRLTQLLRRTNPAKWERLDRHERQSVIAPPIPIPGSWYDADYFEHGRKSNWRDGYTWQAFRRALSRDGGISHHDAAGVEIIFRRRLRQRIPRADTTRARQRSVGLRSQCMGDRPRRRIGQTFLASGQRGGSGIRPRI